jgi:phage gpG-like protein
MISISVDTSLVTKRLERIEEALSRRGLEKLGRTAEKYMQESINAAFSSASDPETGRAWAPRKHSYSNPPLSKTGELRNWIKTESKAWVGNRASRLYLKFEVPDTKEALIKAGSLLHGRKQHRSDRGTRMGGRPITGYMPGRKYLGLTRSAKQKISSAAKSAIRAR